MRRFRRNFAKTIRASTNTTAIIATCHDDLADALAPDILIDCDFGQYTLHHLTNGNGATL